MTGVPQADGYSEGLACEHDYMLGPPCREPASVVTPGGRAYCDPHFLDWLRGQSGDVVALRRDSRRLP